MNAKKKTWTFALPIAAAGLFAIISQSEPAHADISYQPTGPLVPFNGGTHVTDDPMGNVCEVVDRAVRDDLKAQSRTPSIDTTTLGEITKVSGNIFH